MDQQEIVQRLLDEARDDGHKVDLTARDMLDYMAILGVQFVEGAGASAAYLESLKA